jgi:hypothetical protein
MEGAEKASLDLVNKGKILKVIIRKFEDTASK